MDKRTLLAVVLSVVIITIGFVVQNVLFPPQPAPVGTESATSEPSAGTSAQGTESEASQPEATQAPSPQQSSNVQSAGITAQPDTSLSKETVTIETDKYIATFSNVGGVLTSLKLKEHMEGDNYVDMLYTGGEGYSAFNIRFGGPDAAPLKDLFHYRKLGNDQIEFYRTYILTGSDGSQGKPFTIRKRFTFTPEDYLVELDVTIENSVNEVPALVNDNFSYTLGFGPQIGPTFQKLDGRYEYRRFYVYEDGKRKEIKVSNDSEKTVTDRITWAAIAGKYFSVIGIPDATLYATTFSTLPHEGIPQTSQMYFSRPPLKSSKNTDVFKFYIGPKLDQVLSKYDYADRNGFGVKNLNLSKVLDSNALLGWLQTILKYILLGFYKIIPNYGIAIILLTILVKVVLFPLTHKSYESTSRMQSLAPKVEEIKQKYKNSPNRMNQEMAELYKREGVNPLGGCLPMLLQIPIFFALYGLLNSHFNLRGAVFIPGWITDLSAPESILHLPFQIPILGWTDIRLLPFLYVGTQILSQRFTTTPDSASNKNMKMMMYMMPIMFFFILYNMPSGLLLYWTMTNFLTAGQQMYINKHVRNGKKSNGGSPVRK